MQAIRTTLQAQGIIRVGDIIHWSQNIYSGGYFAAGHYRGGQKLLGTVTRSGVIEKKATYRGDPVYVVRQRNGNLCIVYPGQLLANDNGTKVN
jgi:hypothetical protein